MGDGDFDVAVVGLGPVGLATALLLSQHLGSSARVAAIETTDAAEFARSPRAVAIDDETVRGVVQTIGLLDRFRATAERCGNLQVVKPESDGSLRLVSGYASATTPGPGKRGTYPTFHPSLKPGPNGLPLGGYAFWGPQLERDMLAKLRAASNVTMLVNHRLEELAHVHPDSNKPTATDDENSVVRLTLVRTAGSWARDAGGEWRYTFVSPASAEKPTTIRAKFVVGCDGARSTVRRLSFPRSNFSSLDYDARWLASDVTLLRPDVVGTLIPSFSHHVASSEREIIIIGGTSHSPDLKPPSGGYARHLRIDARMYDDEKDVGAVFRSVMQNLGLEEGVHYDGVRFVEYRFHSLIAKQWRAGRIVLCGDAAHVHPPFLGQGLNGGFRDAASVSWRVAAALRGHGRFPVLLDGYVADRAPHAEKAIVSTIEVGQIAERTAASLPLRPGDDTLVSRFYARSQSFSNRLRERRPQDPFAGALFPQMMADSALGPAALAYLERERGKNVTTDDLLFSAANGPATAVLVVLCDPKDCPVSASAQAVLKALGGVVVFWHGDAADKWGSRPTTPAWRSLVGACDAALVLPDRTILGSIKRGDVDDGEALVRVDLVRELEGSVPASGAGSGASAKL